ncbi:hypothetical protein KBD59_04130 [Candidatus Gracilibacteria bacterium]|nr:hypothetical protein [Candidatus Gracilibacteria bacterium]
MPSKSDYVFVPKVDLNEGISAGKITAAALIGTKDQLFFVPLRSQQYLGSAPTTETFPENETYIAELQNRIANLSSSELSTELAEKVGETYSYRLAGLKKFTIKVGFWIFGGMWLQKESGQLHSINVQPKSAREELRAFYAMYFS